MNSGASPDAPASGLPAACHSLVEFSPVPMAALEGAGHILRYANPAFCRLIAKSKDELTGRPFAEVTRSDSGLTVLDRVYRTGEAEVFTETERPDRPAGWSYAIWPVLDAGQRPAGVMMQVTERTLLQSQTGAMNEALLISSLRQHELTDAAEKSNDQLRKEITHRRRVEGALRESEESYRTLIGQVKDYAIFRTDLAGRAISWNDGVMQILGFSREEFIGQNIVPKIFTAEDVRAGVADRELRTAATEGSASDDRWLQRKDGTRFFAQGVTVGLKDSSGGVIGFTRIFRDMTRQKEVEDALEQSHAELRAHAEELARFNRVAVGRELRMIELKKEINELYRRQGERVPYPLEFERQEGDADV